MNIKNTFDKITMFMKGLPKSQIVNIIVIVSLLMGSGVMVSSVTADGGDRTPPTLRPGTQPSFDEGEEEEDGKLIAWRDDDFISKRLAGDIPLDNQQAGALRAAAARAAARLRKEGYRQLVRPHLLPTGLR